MSKVSRLQIFQGTDAEYRQLHYWVAKQLGKPRKCEECGTTSEKRYHWANASNEYKQDISDWIRLCYLCHFKKDDAYRKSKKLRWGRPPAKTCKRGHEMTDDNIRWRIGRGKPVRYCLKCNNIHQQDWAKRKKEQNQ